MNRFTKGAIAGAVGIVLLLSGAGSFALWNGSASAAAGSVQSGTMTIVANGTGTWTAAHGGGAASPITISTFRAVPGDVLTFTQKVDISATGDNLSALLTVDPTSITAGPGAASAQLAAALTSGMTVTIPGTLPTGITATATPNTYKVTGLAATTTVTVVVTLPFDPTTSGTTAQGGTVDLTKLAITLQQQ
jgi:alternate signal-mediated exported protein